MLGEQRTSNCDFLYPEFNAEGKVPSQVSLASGRRISVSVSSSSLPAPCLTPFTPESGLLWLFGLPPLWETHFQTMSRDMHTCATKTGISQNSIPCMLVPFLIS